MTKVNISITTGIAGHAKSTTMIQDGIKAVKNGNSIYLATPTHTLAQGLKERIMAESQGADSALKPLYSVLYRSVHVRLYKYEAQDVLLIDEASQVSVFDFKSALNTATNYDGEPCEFRLYGDPLQTNPPHDVSVLQLMLLNLTKEKEYRNNTYGEISRVLLMRDFAQAKQISIPTSIKSSINSIELVNLTTNYRLKNKSSFTDFNDKFFNYVKTNAISKGTKLVDLSNINESTQKYYANDIKQLLDEDYGIITPTHALGRAVNSIFEDLTLEEQVAQAPFVRIDDDSAVFLNLKADNFEHNKEVFGFLGYKKPDKQLKPCWYLTVDATQGNEFDNVAYFVGNYQLPTSGTLAHYNYQRLYTALSRGKVNWQFIGKKTTFDTMFDNFSIVSIGNDLNTHINIRFANEFISGLSFEGKPYTTATDFENLAKEWQDYFYSEFKRLKQEDLEDAYVENKDFKFKPMSLADLMKFFDKNAKDNEELQPKYFGEYELGYISEIHDNYVSYTKAINGAKGGAVGGKVSNNGKVQVWFNSLTDDERQDFFDDWFGKSKTHKQIAKDYGFGLRSLEVLVKKYKSQVA